MENGLVALKATFIFQLVLLSALLLSFFVQIEIIFPFERRFVPAGIVELVSLLYLPFGLKIIFAALVGPLAILPILLAHLVVDIYFGNGMSEVLINAPIAVAVVFIPIIIFNFVAERPLMEKLDLTITRINITRYILALALSASLLNALVHSVFLHNHNIDLLAFRFVVGDLGGTIFLLLTLVFVKRSVIRFMHKMIKID